MERLSTHRWAVLGFAASAAYWPSLLEGAFVPRWAAIAVGIPLVSKIDVRALSEPVWLLLGFLLFVCALSLFQSPFLLVGVADLIFVVILSLAFLLGANLTSMDDLMIGTAAGLSLSSALVVLQYSGIWSPFPEGSITPAGLFYNSEMMGEFAALVFVWCVARAISGGGRIYLALSAAAAVAVVMSFSRIGIAVSAVGFLAAWRPGWRVLLALSAAVVVGAAYFLLFGQFSSSFHRVILWGATLMSFSPIGRGLGWASLAFPEEEFSHSDALQALTELGIGGLALIAIPIVAYRSKRGTHADYALLTAVLVEVFVSFPLHFPATGFVAAVVAGFLAGRGPAVCDLPSVSYPHDEPRRVWRRNAPLSNAGRGERLRGLVSVRSVFAKPASLRARPALSTGSA